MQETTIKCPICERNVFADIYEVDAETDIPTETGFHVHCSDDALETSLCDLDFNDAVNLHHTVFLYLRQEKVLEHFLVLKKQVWNISDVLTFLKKVGINPSLIQFLEENKDK
ncbi:hypothetical protein ACE193_15410 [Bernardetia sp. OM2101]|uniref:hypothetical protein n=1 Tax=Bernardetia sp. OM2101 TaxID=3344876 RepID=UPI0035D0AB6C